MTDRAVVNQIRDFVVLTGGRKTAKDIDNTECVRFELTHVVGFVSQ